MALLGNSFEGADPAGKYIPPSASLLLLLSVGQNSKELNRRCSRSHLGSRGELLGKEAKWLRIVEQKNKRSDQQLHRTIKSILDCYLAMDFF